jgi:cytochrome c556
VKHLILGAAAMAAIVTTAAAQNRAPAAADAIHARQGRYKQMAAAMKGIRDELRGGTPEIAPIREGSHLIAGYALQLLRWFPRGTGAETGVRTRARPEIWSDAAGFHRAGAELLVAARALEAAAQSGDIARIRAAAPQVAHACSACHDDYRAPEQ